MNIVHAFSACALQLLNIIKQTDYQQVITHQSTLINLNSKGYRTTKWNQNLFSWREKIVKFIKLSNCKFQALWFVSKLVDSNAFDMLSTKFQKIYSGCKVVLPVSWLVILTTLSLESLNFCWVILSWLMDSVKTFTS